MAIAELEADGRYVEADHDPFFESFGDHALTPDDLALFPDYLVCIPPDRNAAPENANLIGDAVVRAARSRFWSRRAICSRNPRWAPATSRSACAACGSG